MNRRVIRILSLGALVLLIGAPGAQILLGSGVDGNANPTLEVPQGQLRVSRLMLGQSKPNFDVPLPAPTEPKLKVLKTYSPRKVGPEYPAVGAQSAGDLAEVDAVAEPIPLPFRTLEGAGMETQATEPRVADSAVNIPLTSVADPFGYFREGRMVPMRSDAGSVQVAVLEESQPFELRIVTWPYPQPYLARVAPNPKTVAAQLPIDGQNRQPGNAIFFENWREESNLQIADTRQFVQPAPVGSFAQGPSKSRFSGLFGGEDPVFLSRLPARRGAMIRLDQIK